MTMEVEGDKSSLLGDILDTRNQKSTFHSLCDSILTMILRADTIIIPILQLEKTEAQRSLHPG